MFLITLVFPLLALNKYMSPTSKLNILQVNKNIL